MLLKTIQIASRRSSNAFVTNLHSRSVHVLSSFISQQRLTPKCHDETFYFTNDRMHQLQQQRYMGRKDGNKSFYKVRSPTRKQKKKYHKRKREEHQYNVERHSKPGAKAGPRREFIENEFQHLVDRAQGIVPLDDEKHIEYDYGNALVDDLIGNSAHLSSTPTPKPLYIGNQHEKHLERVSKMMIEYNNHLQLVASCGDDKEQMDALSEPPLPTDTQISLLIRSYRDKNSTKTKKPGIINALRHIITDAKVPTTLFGSKTYSSLMLCAASPMEARRIMKMMHENKVDIDAYIYSILIDIYAKQGDFRGADDIFSEMRYEGIDPSLPAFTSLLAACYKLVNNATTPRAIKKEAGDLAWNRWKELKIIGLEPDVLCYGAIIRIMAARGLPEQAMNLIEEMQLNQIKPTTLIFTSALKAVARSHANALRFEGGKSKKNKRREQITAHHGKMTRRLVVLAEQAQVEQDEGYIAALMMCAGTAGDTATVKAIYLAHEVQKLEHLRTIGGPEHLLRLQGKDPTYQEPMLNSISNQIQDKLMIQESGEDKNMGLALKDSSSEFLPSRERKWKKDTRILTALLQANANAITSKGLGSIWVGRENKGYLCENSLRMIQQRYIPQYVDKSIPGMDGTESGLSSMVWDDEDVEKMGKRLRRKKFMGLLEDTEDNRIDELDPMLYRLFVEDKDDLFDSDDDTENGNESYEDSYHFDGSGALNESDKNLPALRVGRIEKSEDVQEMMKEMDLDDIFNDGHDGTDSIDLNNSLPETRISQNPAPKFDIVEEEYDTVSSPLTQLDSEIEIKDDLDIVLYGLPSTRIEKVRSEFKRNLGMPSMLRLVPLLRENMPENITRDWLIQKNIKDARIVVNKAENEGVLNDHMRQSMLQVYAQGKNPLQALDYYTNEIKNATPVNERTIFQMLIEKKRLSEALKFKAENVESKGRHLDLLSYGSLVEHYGNHGDITSAMEALKECINKHGFPPAEKSLSKLRLICRQNELEKQKDLESLIGPDPLSWLREGESSLKREYSKKGRKNLYYIRNRLTSI